MALADRQPVVTFTMVDATGSRFTPSFNIDSTILLAAGRVAANALLVELEAASGCTVEGYSITYPTVETNPAPAAAGSRGERKGVLDFRTDAGKMYSPSIPGIVDAVVLASGQIDEDNALILPISLRLLAAPWTDSNGAGLSAIIGAYEKFTRTTKRQLPSIRVAD